MEEDGGGCCWSADEDHFLYSLPRDYICHHSVPIMPCRSVAAPDVLILSFVTVSLTVLVSEIDFFFTTTSSLTKGSLVTSTSSLFNGTLISVFDFTGPSGDEEESLAGLLSTTSSSCVTGTSIVFFSATCSFVRVYCVVEVVFD